MGLIVPCARADVRAHDRAYYRSGERAIGRTGYRSYLDCEAEKLLTCNPVIVQGYFPEEFFWR
jgi:hypothetical protein